MLITRGTIREVALSKGSSTTYSPAIQVEYSIDQSWGGSSAKGRIVDIDAMGAAKSREHKM